MPFFRSSGRPLAAAALVLASLAAEGCQRSTTSPTPPTTQATGGGIETAPVQQPQIVPAAAAPATFPPPPPDLADGAPGVVETWDAFSMRAAGQLVRVGYSRTTVMPTKGQGGQPVIRTCNFTRTVLERAGQPVQQDMQMVSLDTPDGRLVAFEIRLDDVVTTGVVLGNRLEITTVTAGCPERRTIPWQADWGGPLAAEQSTRRRPLKPGERRAVHCFMPIVNEAGDTILQAADYEMVEMPGGPQKLLKVESTMVVGAQRIDSTQWGSAQGETLKSIIPAVGQESVRTTREVALQRSASGNFDLLLTSTVPLPGGFPNAQQTRKAVYLAKVKSGPIEGVFSNCPSQQVSLRDEQTAELIVSAIRPETKLTVAATPPAADDRAPSSYIQSDNPEIVRLASSIVPGETDPWKIACALEKHVDKTIETKNFSQAFSTAAEVARTLEGDCTEHAVLFAALCRARRIPARCAFGLIYYEPLKGFAFHMWNEVWITDRWVPMDATLGQGGIAADHLKLGDTSLSGASPLADLLGVIGAFGRLQLEVVSAE